jgi:hypothetical protein
MMVAIERAMRWRKRADESERTKAAIPPELAVRFDCNCCGKLFYAELKFYKPIIKVAAV